MTWLSAQPECPSCPAELILIITSEKHLDYYQPTKTIKALLSWPLSLVNENYQKCTTALPQRNSANIHHYPYLLHHHILPRCDYPYPCPDHPGSHPFSQRPADHCPPTQQQQETENKILMTTFTFKFSKIAWQQVSLSDFQKNCPDSNLQAGLSDQMARAARVVKDQLLPKVGSDQRKYILFSLFLKMKLNWKGKYHLLTQCWFADLILVATIVPGAAGSLSTGISVFIDGFLKTHKLTNKVDEVEVNNDYYQNNNYSNVNNNNLLELPAPSSPGLRRWQR